ncbi:serum factor response D-like [Diachasma alloeum]|uniref:serum factor response D-like n=1 Tax=Diachasma alloeum TaxID=454923 RepID=UPI00073826FD|nr:serum factor response D-like [Diachasma alloeum]
MTALDGLDDAVGETHTADRSARAEKKDIFSAEEIFFIWPNFHHRHQHHHHQSSEWTSSSRKEPNSSNIHQEPNSSNIHKEPNSCNSHKELNSTSSRKNSNSSSRKEMNSISSRKELNSNSSSHKKSNNSSSRKERNSSSRKNPNSKKINIVVGAMEEGIEEVGEFRGNAGFQGGRGGNGRSGWNQSGGGNEGNNGNGQGRENYGKQRARKNLDDCNSRCPRQRQSDITSENGNAGTLRLKSDDRDAFADMVNIDAADDVDLRELSHSKTNIINTVHVKNEKVTYPENR